MSDHDSTISAVGFASTSIFTFHSRPGEILRFKEDLREGLIRIVYHRR